MIPAYSSDTVLIGAQRRGDPVPPGYVAALPILVVSRGRLDVWSGWSATRIAMSVTGSQIEAVTMGRTTLGSGYAPWTIDVRLKGGSGPSLAFAPMSEDWLYGAYLSAAGVDECAHAVRSRFGASERNETPRLD
ncbi:hypothetical protein EDD26_2178 [Agrococcus jenensis]|uniref:Uncharacterized protein n=1 Tax=Agrococcus jenensis TaxID=46353 RepID=A0A3N2AUQ8_9MICO|nr:hypothetical protein EDD26_2178 [Agrococcus jenensis]